MLSTHVAQAERHVARGKVIIGKQRSLVAELARDGHDTAEARGLLACLNFSTSSLQVGTQARRLCSFCLPRASAGSCETGLTNLRRREHRAHVFLARQ